MELLKENQEIGTELGLIKGMTKKEYSQNYYQENKEYYHDYYMEHKEKYKDSAMVTARNWRMLNQGDYVYFLVSEDNEQIYTGSYYSRPLIERISFHMHGHSNLHMTASELEEKFGLSVCLFKNFKKYGLNDHDLMFIEDYFKNKYPQILGKNKVPWKEEKLSKSKEELIQIADSEPFKEFSIDKYLYN